MTQLKITVRGDRRGSGLCTVNMISKADRAVRVALDCPSTLESSEYFVHKAARRYQIFPLNSGDKMYLFNSIQSRSRELEQAESMNVLSVSS